MKTFFVISGLLMGFGYFWLAVKKADHNKQWP